MAGNEWQVPILVAAIRAVALAALGAPRHGSAASPVNRQPGTFLFVVDPQRTPSVRRRTGNTSTAGPPTEARAAGSPLGGELFYDSVSFRTCSVTVQCNAYARKPSTRALNVSRSYSIIFGLLMHSLARSRRWPARLQPQPAFAAACRVRSDRLANSITLADVWLYPTLQLDDSH